MEIHFFSKSPAERTGLGLSRMTGGSPGKGALGISIYKTQHMAGAQENHHEPRYYLHVVIQCTCTCRSNIVYMHVLQ